MSDHDRGRPARRLAPRLAALVAFLPFAPALAPRPVPAEAAPGPARPLWSLSREELDRELEARRGLVRRAEADLRGSLDAIRKDAEALSDALRRGTAAGLRAEAAHLRQPGGAESRGEDVAVEAIAGEYDRKKAEILARKARARGIVDWRLGPASNRMAEVVTEMRRRDESARIDAAIDAASRMVLELEPVLAKRR